MFTLASPLDFVQCFSWRRPCKRQLKRAAVRGTFVCIILLSNFIIDSETFDPLVKTPCSPSTLASPLDFVQYFSGRRPCNRQLKRAAVRGTFVCNILLSNSIIDSETAVEDDVCAAFCVC